MAQRSPILGYNHNIRHRGLVFHVQTEDSGVSNPHIFTHMFHGGVILETRKLNYDPSQSEPAVKSLMQAQHKAVLRELLKGLFDTKITQYLGDNPDLEPPKDEVVAVASARVGAEPEADEDWAIPTVTFSKPRTPTERAIAATTAGVPQTRVPLPTSPALPAVNLDGDEPAHVHSPALSSVPEAPGAAAPRVGTYAQHRGSSSHGVVTRAVADAPTQPVTRSPSGATPPRRPASTQVRGTGPASARRRRRSSASNVVVSRPAVIVGAPPKVVGGRSGPVPDGSRPARARKAREESSGEGLFGQDLISEKSLDEVILAYLSEDGNK